MPFLRCLVSCLPVRPWLLALVGLSPSLQAATGASAVGPSGGLLQVIFGLLLVALLLAGSLYLLKRLAVPARANALLRVICATAVGTRERVVVVEVGETWLVLGVAAGQINKLHELPRQTLPTHSQPAAPHQLFAEKLGKIMAQRNNPRGPSVETEHPHAP
ncbi:MAG: flagellar biosynthetic protein FliO [Sterolibacterium sp.]|nr:flagellar biosynthetic protein FliO [Sterolibacterium sp.]